MKVCPNCNATWQDDVQFCANCGRPIPADPQPNAAPQNGAPNQVPPQNDAPNQVPPQNGAPNQAPPAYQPPVNYYQPPMAEEPVSTWKWVLYHLIPLIPAVGPLVFLIMLFVWGFGSDKNETFRNWAKSQLIIMGISVVLGILILAIFIALFGSLAAIGSGMDSFDYEYYNW